MYEMIGLVGLGVGIALCGWFISRAMREPRVVRVESGIAAAVTEIARAMRFRVKADKGLAAVPRDERPPVDDPAMASFRAWMLRNGRDMDPIEREDLEVAYRVVVGLDREQFPGEIERARATLGVYGIQHAMA